MFNKKPEKPEKTVSGVSTPPVTKTPIVEPVVEPVKEGNLRVVAGNPDEKVINGKLFKSVGYMENGCSKYKLEEVK